MDVFQTVVVVVVGRKEESSLNGEKDGLAANIFFLLELQHLRCDLED